MLKKILYPELSYKITGLCFQVHKKLGRLAREKQYADYLEHLLKEQQIKFKREIKIPFQPNQTLIEGNIADFIIENKIIIDCKAKRAVTKQDYYQIQRYLQATKIKLGLIINFNDRYLKPRRIINYS